MRMLIWEYSTADLAEPRRIVDAHAGDAELFLRDDKPGSMVVLERRGEAGSVGGDPAPKNLDVLFAEGRCGKSGGDVLFVVGLWTPEDYRDEFLAWYRMEHLPILLECPLWDGCRFVEQKLREGCQFFAMHQLADKAALDSEERRRSRSTPWFRRLAGNEWFDGAFTRVLYRRV